MDHKFCGRYRRDEHGSRCEQQGRSQAQRDQHFAKKAAGERHPTAVAPQQEDPKPAAVGTVLSVRSLWSTLTVNHGALCVWRKCFA